MDPYSGKPPRPIVSEFATDPEMADLVRQFVSELPARITALEGEWRERRIQNVARLAHQLKGSCAGYGFPALGTAAATLEDRLRATGEASAEAALAKAASEFRALVDLCARVCPPPE
jgi:HPt (histidine-containing phosphotransfer) domain-containing protein